jgi:hypothetical protein
MEAGSATHGTGIEAWKSAGMTCLGSVQDACEAPCGDRHFADWRRYEVSVRVEERVHAHEATGSGHARSADCCLCRVIALHGAYVVWNLTGSSNISCRTCRSTCRRFLATLEVCRKQRWCMAECGSTLPQHGSEEKEDRAVVRRQAWLCRLLRHVTQLGLRRHLGGSLLLRSQWQVEYAEARRLADALATGVGCHCTSWRRYAPLCALPCVGSSIGRAAVSKTAGCRFDSCPTCPDFKPY